MNKKIVMRNSVVRNIFRRLSLVTIILTLLVNCQSAPQVPDVFTGNVSAVPLESGASVYLFANAAVVRPIINNLPFEELREENARKMLEKTDYLAAAMFPRTSGRRFQAVGWGKYPSSQAGFAFSINNSWRQERSNAGGNYWHSGANRLSIALESRRAFIISSLNSEPCDPRTAQGMEIPGDLNEFRGNAPLYGWMEDPSSAILRIMNDAGLPFRIPVQKLYFSLSPAASQKYEAVLRLQFESVSQARGLSSILGLAGNFISPDPGSFITMIFFANPPVQNNSYVDIRTAEMDESEIAQLLNLFLLTN